MPIPETISISEAFELYRRDFLHMKNRSSKTDESYSGAAKLLDKRFGDRDVCSLTFNDVRNWSEWLQGWQRQDTVKNNITCLRMVLKFLRYRGYPVMNYEEIPVPKREKRQIKYLTKEEVDDFIFDTAKKQKGYSAKNRLRNVVIVKLLYATGIRNSELCALNRDTIRNGQFTVIGKSRDPHISFIDEDTEKALKEYLKTRTDSNSALFISHITGKRITSSILRDIFQSICARSTRFDDIHPHTLRHSYGTKMIHKGVDLRFIGDLMGHASLDTTRLYTHVENPQLKAIYEKAHAK